MNLPIFNGLSMRDNVAAVGLVRKNCGACSVTGLETLPHCRHNLALVTVFDHSCTVLEKARLLKKMAAKGGKI